MAAQGEARHEAAAKLCGENDDDMIAAVGDRSIFSLDDINLDDIFVDLNENDIPTFVTDNPSDSSLFSSGDPHGSAAESVSQLGVDDPTGGDLLPEGLLCDDIDVTQLEWLSNFCEESYSSDSLLGFVSGDSAAFGGGAGCDNAAAAAASTAVIKGDMANFRSTSPISVLEHNSPTVGLISSPAPLFSTAITSSCTSSLSSPTSSSCSGTGDLHRKMARPQSDPVIVPARSRSKRPRPASFSPRPPIVVPPPSTTTPLLLSSASAASGASEEYDNFHMVSGSMERQNDDPDGLEEEEEEKKKQKKKASPPVTAEGEEAAVSSPQVRKCMHCESTKTPQWRAGPSGPKTLCNACGVRYKSGRLFPEYRPAASPTYMASLHSNSHKRVVEMRNKLDAVTEEGKGARQDVASKACELLHYIRVREWCADDDHRGGVACD